MHKEIDIRTTQEIIEDIKYELSRLKDDERLDIFSEYCTCGNDKPCKCWNDV